MTDQSMDPQYESNIQDDVLTGIQAGLTWNSGGVTITLPTVENASPTSVTWDGTSATESNGRWSGSGNNSTNSLSVSYPSGTYSNSSIARDSRTASLSR